MAKTYEINGRPVTKEEYEDVMGKMPNNHKANPRPVDNKTSYSAGSKLLLNSFVFLINLLVVPLIAEETTITLNFFFL